MWIATLSVINICIGSFLWSEGAKRSGVLMLGIISILSPLWVYVASILMLHDKMSKRTIIAASISIAGTAVLVLGPVMSDNSGLGSLYGPLLVLAGNMVSSFSIVASKKTLSRVDPLAFTAIQNIFGAMPLVVIMIVSGSWQQLLHLSVQVYGAILLLITTNGALTFYLWNYGMRRVHADIVAEQNYIQTLLICSLAVALGEKVSLSFVAGSSLVIIGTIANHAHIHRVWWMHQVGILHSDIKKFLRAPHLAFQYIVEKNEQL